VARLDDVRTAIAAIARMSGVGRLSAALLRSLAVGPALLLVWLAACDGRERPPMRLATLSTASRSSAARNVRAVIDSSLRLDEALRRFRAGLPLVTKLSGGAPSRDDLVRRFVRAVEDRDTASVRAMVLSRAEFAYLYYPDSPFTREPHKQTAGLVWFFTQANSSKGITRVFDRLGGHPFRYRGYRCDPRPRRHGSNLLWENCLLQAGDPGAMREMRLFGSIIERDGELKFVSYANDF
jgi:hypothetical protein